MNKAGIKTYDDLVAERKRLEALLVVQKQRVADDWTAVKAEFEPVANTFGAIGKLTHPDRSNPILNIGLKFASDLLLKNFILSKAGWLTRLAVPLVMKNYSSHLLAEDGKGILNRIKHGLGRIFKSRKNARHGSRQESSEYGRADQDREYGTY